MTVQPTCSHPECVSLCTCTMQTNQGLTSFSSQKLKQCTLLEKLGCWGHGLNKGKKCHDFQKLMLWKNLVCPETDQGTPTKVLKIPHLCIHSSHIHVTITMSKWYPKSLYARKTWGTSVKQCKEQQSGSSKNGSFINFWQNDPNTNIYK